MCSRLSVQLHRALLSACLKCAALLAALLASSGKRKKRERKGVRSFIIIFSLDIAMARPYRLEFARVGLNYTSINRIVKLA